MIKTYFNTEIKTGVFLISICNEVILCSLYIKYFLVNFLMILKWHNTIIFDIADETLILKLCRICCEEEPRGRKRDKEIDWVIHNMHVEKKGCGVYVPDTNSICILGKCPSKGTRF